jgi:hypothetical protein
MGHTRMGIPAIVCSHKDNIEWSTKNEHGLQMVPHIGFAIPHLISFLGECGTWEMIFFAPLGFEE